MKTRCAFVLALVTVMGASAALAGAEEAAVTYYKDVLPIVQENCQSCHRGSGDNISGLVAPMPFMSYQDTRPWARAIARQVETKAMPPWFASEPTGVFENERGLTDDEIATIVSWVEAGAPAGDMARRPCSARVEHGYCTTAGRSASPTSS